MCKLKSAIILKDRVFIPDYDSHRDMLEELKIDDTTSNAERIFVRAELSPEDGDVFTDIDRWIFKVDQDIIPEWFVWDFDKKRMIEAVKSWAKNRIYIGVDNLSISEGKNYYIKNCKNVKCYNSSVTAWGNSIVTKPYHSVFKNEHLILCENATFKDCNTKTIYQNGDYKLVDVSGKDLVDGIHIK